MIQKLLCTIRGHEWDQVRHVPVHVDGPFSSMDRVVGKCRRCGCEAQVSDVLKQTAYNSSPPSGLLEQSPEQELAALYAAGRINDDELEELAEEAVSDDP
jgi:hypothetical protein